MAANTWAAGAIMLLVCKSCFVFALEITESSADIAADQVELTNEQVGTLLHYFGIDSSDSLESILQGIDALGSLQRS